MNDPVWAGPAGFWAICGAILGAVAGSFLATLAIRWSQGRSMVHGRSACDRCGAPIRGVRLTPIAGFLWLRGRAGCCGAPIDRRHIAMEIGCASLGALALALRPGVDGVVGALFGWLLATLALLDHDRLWLPDRLTGTLAVLGLAGGLAGLAPPLADRLIGGMAGWAALFAIGWSYRRLRGREGLGQGDAKLLGGIGLWLGWRPLPWVVLGASLIGIAWVLATRARGRIVARDDALPLGALLATAAWGAWLLDAFGWPD